MSWTGPNDAPLTTKEERMDALKQPVITAHEFDDDAVCIHCGFDGAEWHWWKNHTYEGRASDIKRPPICEPRRAKAP